MITLSNQTSTRDSIGNTTTTPLAGGATFTGQWERVNSPDVMVSCRTDGADGATLFFDFSPDGTNLDSTFPPAGFKVGSFNEFHTAVKGNRFFRVRLVNNASAQTFLRLFTYYGRFRQGNLPISSDIGEDADAIVVRSVNSELDLALGRFGGLTPGTKFGRNPDVDTGIPEDIWHGGGTYTGHPVSFTPETVNVRSDNANDAAAGTGARTVRIFGLKTSASTEYESEDITLNGTSNVASVESWWRINRAYVLTAGSGGENAGIITVESSVTTANVFAQMPVGFNQTQIAAYTVPAEMRMLVKRVRVSIVRNNGSAGSATISFRIREPGGVYRAIRPFEVQTGGPVNYTEFAGEVFPAGSDVKFRVDQVSDNNTICEAAFEYVLTAE